MACVSTSEFIIIMVDKHTGETHYLSLRGKGKRHAQTKRLYLNCTNLTIPQSSPAQDLTAKPKNRQIGQTLIIPHREVYPQSDLVYFEKHSVHKL